MELILPGAVHGFGIGLIDASVFPIMAVLVDIRHRAVYGSVYAIADLSFCAAFVAGMVTFIPHQKRKHLHSVTGFENIIAYFIFLKIHSCRCYEMGLAVTILYRVFL